MRRSLKIEAALCKKWNSFHRLLLTSEVNKSKFYVVYVIWETLFKSYLFVATKEKAR